MSGAPSWRGRGALVEDQLQVLLPKLIGTSGNFETIVFGIVLVLVLKYAPDGLWSFVGAFPVPKPQRVRDWARRRAAARAQQARHG
jgi:branched-chain amino acid transport system permease protein